MMSVQLHLPIFAHEPYIQHPGRHRMAQPPECHARRERNQVSQALLPPQEVARFWEWSTGKVQEDREDGMDKTILPAAPLSCCLEHWPQGRDWDVNTAGRK